MAGHFVKIEDAGVILCNRGVFKSCDVYTTIRMCRTLYAKVGTGFIKLRPRGNTSTNAKWERIDGVSYDVEGLALRMVALTRQDKAE